MHWFLTYRLCMWQVILVDELLKFFSRRVKSKLPTFLLVCASNDILIIVGYCFELNLLLCSSLCIVYPRLTVSADFHDIFRDPQQSEDSEIVTLILQAKFRLSDSERTIYYQRVIHGNSSCSF
jgi:hypothetical protein